MADESPHIDGGKLDDDNGSDFPVPPQQLYPHVQGDIDAAVAALQTNVSAFAAVQQNGAIALNVLGQISPVLNLAFPGAGSGLSLAMQAISKILTGLPQG